MKLAQVHNDKKVLPQDEATGLPSGEDATQPAKECQGEPSDTTKKQHGGSPGELCELNLDVLFIVYRFSLPCLTVC